MKVVISSRQLAPRRVSNHLREEGNYCVISCTDPNTEFPSFPVGALSRQCQAVLLLKFGDIDEPDIEEYPAITDEQAETVAAFIKANRHVDTLYINCDAGICRSSAVAAAASLYINGCDKWVWDDGRYMPNRYVYRKVLEALGLSNNYDRESKSE